MSRKFSGTIASAAVLSNFPVRMNEHKGVSVQVQDAGTGCTLSYKWSNDRTTWYPASGFAANARDRQPVQTTAVVGLWFFPRMGAYFRVECSTYGSGSPDVVCELLDNEVPQIGLTPVSADWSYAAASGGIADTSDVALAAAAGAGLRNYLHTLQLANADVSVATEVVVKDGSTVIWRTWLPAGAAANTAPVPQSYKFDPPLKTTANAALNIAAITTSAMLYANAQGRIGA